MRLSCASWSFPECNLPEIVDILAALGIDAVDLGIDYRSGIDRALILNNPSKTGEKLHILGADFPCFHYRFAPTLDGRNIADPSWREQNIADFSKVIDFCKAAWVPIIFILPGMINAGQTVSSSLDEAIKTLNLLMPIAQEAGIILAVEPHVRSNIENPELALSMLEQVPGLKLMLDYSNIICLGYRQNEIDILAPHAAHVQLRQAKPGLVQTKLHHGTINFPALLGTLRDVGYEGYIGLKHTHQGYMNNMNDDVLTEIIQMRNLVRAYT
ncbi:MAG: sugar phosphate isomerase/epimerase [Opitutaceae bacterium]|nr:sugar phosphate isomerase/epimerase [Opitutaceae bacterium]